jgi:hypothetical protein
MTHRASAADTWMSAPDDTFPGYRDSGHSAGHYVADRAAIGRLNANEIQHPAAVWYGCVGHTSDQWTRGGQDYDYGSVVIGRKPLKGYRHWVETLTRAPQGHHTATLKKGNFNPPYHLAFWYENQYADVDSMVNHSGYSFQHIHHATLAAEKRTSVYNSPVYTIYVTAQVLDSSEQPMAETRLRATVERTWDGKLNMLDFKWVMQDEDL